MMPATGYLVAKGTLDPILFLICLPLLPLGYLFILAVELPDMEGDRAGGKRTAVVRMGRGAALRSIAAAGLLSTALFLASGLASSDPARTLLLAMTACSVIPAGAGLLALHSGARDREGAEKATGRLIAGLVLFFLFSDTVLAAGLV
jgi:1,4-dihydroxy-2-naphthoate octaprenyltransferase